MCLIMFASKEGVVHARNNVIYKKDYALACVKKKGN